MSTPHVAAVAGLVWAAFPKCRNSDCSDVRPALQVRRWAAGDASAAAGTCMLLSCWHLQAAVSPTQLALPHAELDALNQPSTTAHLAPPQPSSQLIRYDQPSPKANMQCMCIWPRSIRRPTPAAPASMCCEPDTQSHALVHQQRQHMPVAATSFGTCLPGRWILPVTLTHV
jgi:hypothetical protein